MTYLHKNISLPAKMRINHTQFTTKNYRGIAQKHEDEQDLLLTLRHFAYMGELWESLIFFHR
jgi:hypothetical protein